MPDVPSTIEAQANGIVKPLDPVDEAYRLEIDEFVQNGPLLNLFLLALEALQDNKVITDLKEKWKNFDHYNKEAKEKFNKQFIDHEKYWWSFFSIAGIHGLPTQYWEHKHPVKDRKDPPKDASYCLHGSQLFPTWHRPYVFMMEQAIFNKIYSIAREFPETITVRRGKVDIEEPCRAKYVDAARAFRLPYWDPWMPRNNTGNLEDSHLWNTRFGVPAILRAQEVFVRRPNAAGKLVEIDNPLYRYKVPRHRDLLGDATVGWTTFSEATDSMDEATIRNPSSQHASKNNDIVLDYELRTQALGMAGKHWQLLVNMAGSKGGWEVFSNHTKPLKDRENPEDDYASPEVSLESWHDDIHDLLGSGRGAAGNMTIVPIAAFDPIFWLHHNNIDRILALYQAIHPDIFVPEEALTTPLKPFYKSAGTEDKDFWNSTDAKDWGQCGFAVPGTARPTTERGRDDLRKVVEGYLRETYEWVATQGNPPPNLRFPKSMDPIEALIGREVVPPPKTLSIKAVAAKKEAASLVGRSLAVGEAETGPDKVLAAPTKYNINLGNYPSDHVKDGKYITWNAHITVKKYAYDGSFNINFFLGHIDKHEAADFMLLQNQIGYSGVFANPSQVECENCDRLKTAGALYADAVPLTLELTKYLEKSENKFGVPEDLRTLQSLEPEHVVPYLKENLQWQITTPEGTLRSIEGSDLEVRVASRWYHFPTPEAGLGSYSQPEPYAEITQNKPGGYSG